MNNKYYKCCWCNCLFVEGNLNPEKDYERCPSCNESYSFKKPTLLNFKTSWETLVQNILNLDPETVMELAKQDFPIAYTAVTPYEFDLLIHTYVCGKDVWSCGLLLNYFHALYDLIQIREGGKSDWSETTPTLFYLVDYKVLDFSRAALITQINHDNYMDRIKDNRA